MRHGHIIAWPSRKRQKTDSQQTVVDAFVFFQKAADDGFFRIVALVVSQDVQADFRRRFMRISVDACGNAWKRDGDALFFGGSFEAVDVACLQKFGFVMVAATPDRARRVDDVFAWKSPGTSQIGFTRLAAADFDAFFKQGRAGGAMNRAVHTAAAKQRAIRGVDDCIRVELGDVAEDDFDFHGVSLWWSTVMVAAARAAVMPFLGMRAGIRRRAGGRGGSRCGAEG